MLLMLSIVEMAIIQLGASLGSQEYSSKFDKNNMMRALSQHIALLAKWVLIRLLRDCEGELAEPRVSRG